jgi:hypothetical protein
MGGNNVSLGDKPCRNELHGEWDQLLGRGNKTDDAVKYASQLPAPEAKKAGITDLQLWVKESFIIAQHDVYMPQAGGSPGPYNLDAAYREAARKIARQQAPGAAPQLAALKMRHSDVARFATAHPQAVAFGHAAPGIAPHDSRSRPPPRASAFWPWRVAGIRCKCAFGPSNRESGFDPGSARQVRIQPVRYSAVICTGLER